MEGRTTLLVSEPACFGFQRGDRYQVFPVLHPAFQLDRIAPAQALLEFVQGKLHVAVAAGDGTVIAPVSLLVRIAARAGVEKGKDLVVELEREVADVLAVIAVGMERRHIGLEACRINDDVRALLRSRRVGWLAGAGERQQDGC